MIKLVLFVFANLTVLASAEVTFIKNPSIKYDTVEFEVSEATDVEVAIVNLADSTIIRHLAAGVLGSNPPAPLIPDSLHQVLVWDGKGDYDVPVTVSQNQIGVRVRAGMGVSIAAMVEGSPYDFRYLSGMFLDDSGNVALYGGCGENNETTVRIFSPDMDYLRTAFPYPSGLPVGSVTGFGVWQWADNTYSPAVAPAMIPNLSASLIGLGRDTYGDTPTNVQPVRLLVGGRIMLFEPVENKALFLNADWTYEGPALSVPLVTSPAYIGHYNVGGRGYVTPSADGKSLYLSGVYYTTGTQVDTAVLAPDTGFWRDGRVFKVDLNTGVAAPFITLDSVFRTVGERKNTIGPGNANMGYAYMSAVHGTAVDDSGRLYICDRLHGQIGVYDTTGLFLGKVLVRYPDEVSVNPVTGEIHVLSRLLSGSGQGYLKLYKFAGWRNEPAALCSATVQAGDMGNLCKAFLTRSDADGKTVLHVLYKNALHVFEDNGDAITRTSRLDCYGHNVTEGFSRMTVDPRTETVIMNDSRSGLFQITDWSDPVFSPCSTSAGQRLYGTDACVSPDGQLYVREGAGYSGSITRYDMARLHAPIPWANTGGNMLTNYIYSRMSYVMFGEKGLAVAPDKRVAVMYMYSFAAYFVGEYADSGCNATPGVDSVVMPLSPGSYAAQGGLRYDSKGNLYAGVCNVSQFPNLTRESVGGVQAVLNTRQQGNVFRFPKGVHAVPTASGFTGSDKYYTTAISPFSGAWGDCQCTSPRFDIDRFDRLILPHALGQKITVVDNNGNQILRFGTWGNVDQKGPGAGVVTNDVPFAYPFAAASSENYLYVTDVYNTRLVRLKKEFVLDNMPGFDGGLGAVRHVGANNYSPLHITAAPNPFNPVVRIVLSGNQACGATLKVFDLTGRLVADLSGSVRNGVTAWNASGNASGAYVLMARKNGFTSIKKITYSK